MGGGVSQASQDPGPESCEQPRGLAFLGVFADYRLRKLL